MLGEKFFHIKIRQQEEALKEMGDLSGQVEQLTEEIKEQIIEQVDEEEVKKQRKSANNRGVPEEIMPSYEQTEDFLESIE